MTTKQLEQETGCKIMVRGRGSMRDKKKVGARRSKANHLTLLALPTQNLLLAFGKPKNLT